MLVVVLNWSTDAPDPLRSAFPNDSERSVRSIGDRTVGEPLRHFRSIFKGSP